MNGEEVPVDREYINTPTGSLFRLQCARISKSNCSHRCEVPKSRSPSSNSRPTLLEVQHRFLLPRSRLFQDRIRTRDYPRNNLWAAVVGSTSRLVAVHSILLEGGLAETHAAVVLYLRIALVVVHSSLGLVVGTE